MGQRLSRTAKAWTSASVGALAWGAAVIASPSGPVTASEWLTLAGVGVAAVGVFFMPNTDSTPPTPPG